LKQNCRGRWKLAAPAAMPQSLEFWASKPGDDLLRAGDKKARL